MDSLEPVEYREVSWPLPTKLQPPIKTDPELLWDHLLNKQQNQ